MKLRLLSGFCFVLVSKLFIIIVPLIYGHLIDSLSNGQNQTTLFLISLIIVYGLLRFLSGMFSLLQEYILSRPLVRLLKKISTYSFQHLLGLSHDFHLTTNAGSLSQSIQQGIRGITNIFLSLIFGFFPLIMELVLIITAVLFVFDVQFMLVIFGISLAYFFPALYLTNRRLVTLRKINEGEKNINSFIVESFTNFENIKFFHSLNTETKNLNNLWEYQEELNVRSMFQLSTLRLLQRALLCLILVFFLTFSLF
ncbi:MAG: hypothetical protein JNJ47_00170 [Alphaproteobacteria bacterium]|nr:hypothetical protein [Alphaproteobacteria bacterium]